MNSKERAKLLKEAIMYLQNSGNKQDAVLLTHVYNLEDQVKSLRSKVHYAIQELKEFGSIEAVKELQG